MVGLPDLPVELVREVCSQLCTEKYNGGHADISSLSRTCKPLRDIVQPLVFTAFAPDSQATCTSCVQILQLIHALNLRPDLAQYLKYIDLTEADWGDPLSQNEIDLLKWIVTKLNFEPLPPWDTISKPDNNPLPIIELLLFHSPNLVRLELALSDEWRPVFSPAIYRRYAASTNIDEMAPCIILPRLVTLTLTHYCISEYYWELGLTNFLTVLHAAAPNLRYLCTDNPGDETKAVTVTSTTSSTTTMSGGGYNNSIYYPPLTNLLRLEFDCVCSLRKDVLRGIVAAAPGLQVFSLSTTCVSPSSDPNPSISWDLTNDDPESSVPGECTVLDVWEVLHLRKETLREIRLDIMHDMRPGGIIAQDKQDEEFSGSLDEFRRLKVLKVGNYALKVLEELWKRRAGSGNGGGGFLENLLPSCIREVAFWEPEKSWIVPLERLARVMALNPQRYPDLLSVIVAPTPDNELSSKWAAKDAWLRAGWDLKQQFDWAGVLFEAQKMHVRERAGPFELQNPFQF